MIKEVVYKIDIKFLARIEHNKSLNINDICKVQIRTTKSLMIDSYTKNRTTGSIVPFDEMTNEKVAEENDCLVSF